MLDTIVIGSGPAGMSAALYAKRANLDVKVIEKEYCGTGQIAESSQVDNYIGLAGLSGYELGEKFRTDAEKAGVEFVEGEVVQIQKPTGGNESDWSIQLQSGDEIKARTVIYAAGATHRHLGIASEEAFAGKGVSYCAVCDGMFYRDRAVVVIGGGDTALDDALYLSEICKQVYVVHRRTQFRGSQHTLARLQAKANVELVTPAQVVDIKGEDLVQSVVLDSGRELAVDGVFVAVGMTPQTQLLDGVVTLDEQRYVAADETGITDTDGFFVAGDVRTKALRQVVTAVSDGANAAISAERYIRENS